MSETTNRPPSAVTKQLSRFAPKYGRPVLEYFHYQSTPVATLDDLATYVSEDESTVTDQTDVELHLHHATLPILVDADIVDYDPNEHRVRYLEHSFEE